VKQPYLIIVALCWKATFLISLVELQEEVASKEALCYKNILAGHFFFLSVDCYPSFSCHQYCHFFQESRFLLSTYVSLSMDFFSH
jgi:hypothetical protein